MRKKTVITNFDRTVIDLGIALAAVISYTNWHSIPWAILHGFLNWIYVIVTLLQNLIANETLKTLFSESSL